MGKWYRSRTAWIVPLVLCIIALLENIAIFKMHEHVRDPSWRAAITLALNGVGFGVGAAFIAPWLSRFFRQADKETAAAGSFFTLAFYVLAYGLVFYMYLIQEKYGPAGLLPASLR